MSHCTGTSKRLFTVSAHRPSESSPCGGRLPTWHFFKIIIIIIISTQIYILYSATSCKVVHWTSSPVAESEHIYIRTYLYSAAVYCLNSLFADLTPLKLFFRYFRWCIFVFAHHLKRLFVEKGENKIKSKTSIKVTNDFGIHSVCLIQLTCRLFSS